jgi:ribosomal protein L29
MKKNDFQKLKNRSQAELVKDLVEAREKLWNLSRAIADGKEKNNRSAKALRRDIARMLTLVHNSQATEITKAK